MVRRNVAVLGFVAMLGATTATTTCKVVNDEHCANQDVPGNEFCLEFSAATPYCSPCRSEFNGCVDFEPFACPGYSDEISDDPPTGSTDGLTSSSSSGGETEATTSG